MKVKKLIQLLKKVDENKQVYLSSDEEGNAFGAISPLFEEDTKFIIIYPIEYRKLKI